MKSIGERIYPGSIDTTSDYILYLKHLFAYEHAKSVLTNSMRVLEVGCGEGYGTSVLSQGPQDVTGIDIDQQTIDAANQTYGSDNCRFRLFDGEIIPFSNNEFDVIVSFQVIEHVPDDKQFLSEIWRVLKPGGKFYVATPNREYRLKPGQKPWNIFHLREYSADQFARLVSLIFHNYKLYGVYATPEVQRIETDRVYSNRFRTPFRQIIRLWQRIKYVLNTDNKISLPDAKKRYSINNFVLTESGFDTSLDLLAVCIK